MKMYRNRRRAEFAAAVVGIDAGKFTHTLVVRPRDRTDSKPFTFQTDHEGFEAAAEYVREAAPGSVPETTLVGIEFAGIYGFTLACWLARQGYQVVTVLPAHSKRWKEVVHNQRLKTDAKDALAITDLAAKGMFVGFAFQDPAYADLRSLVSARERLTVERRAAISRLKSVLEAVWPEFERRFKRYHFKTPLALLERWPCPAAFLAAPKRSVLRVMRTVSRGHLTHDTYDELRKGAEHTIAVGGADSRMKDEIPLLIERIRMYDRQLETIEGWMVETLERTEAAESVLSVPQVAPVTAAVFLGSVGDPTAYDTQQQVLKVAGLSLVESSSGIRSGEARISKRGRPVLRRSSYMLALRMIQEGGMYREWFDAMVERNGGRKIPAVVAVGRKALGLLYAVARDGRRWTPEPPKRRRNGGG